MVLVYCHDMNGTAPAEYIDTVYDPQAGNLGFSEFQLGVAEYDGSHLTEFLIGVTVTKARLVLPAAVGRAYINTSDLTFATVYLDTSGTGVGDPGIKGYVGLGSTVSCNLWGFGNYGGGFLFESTQSSAQVQLAASPFVLSSNTYRCGARANASCNLLRCQAAPFNCDPLCRLMPPDSTCTFGPLGPVDYVTGEVQSFSEKPHNCPAPGTPAVADYSLSPDPATQLDRLYVDLAPQVPP